jgi:predicted DNA-binding transcriptional regulator YafY
MWETSGRLLTLLSLLQARRVWTAPQLAERLGVTTRTVRKDVARLRDLGYAVEARPGADGGYRLGPQGTLPPLLLDDEEAVAVAIGLRLAATGSVSNLEETSVRALVKLQQLMPSRLRHRVRSFASYAVGLPMPGPLVDVDVLTTVANACRDRERLCFDYTRHDGAVGRRDVEPYRLLNDRRRWYLFGWDVDRRDWRTFRVDRMTPRVPGGPRFAARDLPPDDEIAARVARGIDEATWAFRARVVVLAPADHVRSRLPGTVEVTDLGDGRCVFEAGSDHPEMLALYLGLLDADFVVEDSPELVTALAALAARFQRCVSSYGS